MAELVTAAREPPISNAEGPGGDTGRTGDASGVTSSLTSRCVAGVTPGQVPWGTPSPAVAGPISSLGEAAAPTAAPSRPATPAGIQIAKDQSSGLPEPIHPAI